MRSTFSSHRNRAGGALASTEANLPNVSSLVRMGLGALILQQIADFAVGSIFRGITPLQQIARLSKPAGLIYLTLVITFAAMPVLANRPRQRRPIQSLERTMIRWFSLLVTCRAKAVVNQSPCEL